MLVYCVFLRTLLLYVLCSVLLLISWCFRYWFSVPVLRCGLIQLWCSTYVTSLDSVGYFCCLFFGVLFDNCVKNCVFGWGVAVIYLLVMFAEVVYVDFLYGVHVFNFVTRSISVGFSIILLCPQTKIKCAYINTLVSNRTIRSPVS